MSQIQVNKNDYLRSILHAFVCILQLGDYYTGNANELYLIHLMNASGGGKLVSYLYYFSAHIQSFSYLKYLRLGSIIPLCACRFSTRRSLPSMRDSLIVNQTDERNAQLKATW